MRRTPFFNAAVRAAIARGLLPPESPFVTEIAAEEGVEVFDESNAIDCIDRKSQGAFYTPDPLANFCASRVLLNRDHLPLTIIDPACGTGRLLRAVTDLFAPLEIPLEVYGYDINEEAVEIAREILRWGPGSHQFHLEVRNPLLEGLPPVPSRGCGLVIMNPPYLLSSETEGYENLSREVLDAFRSPVVRNNKLLNDTYIRFYYVAAQWLRQCPEGVFVIISNNNFLSGEVFDRFRSQLAEWFPSGNVFNLFGNARIRQSGNPFGVKVGICVCEGRTWGSGWSYYKIDSPTVEGKYEMLQQLPPPTDIPVPGLPQRIRPNWWQNGVLLSSFFARPAGSGLAFGRDWLLTDSSKDDLCEKLRLFYAGEEDELERRFGGRATPTKTWTPENCREQTTLEQAIGAIQKIYYRVSDIRWACILPGLADGPRIGAVGAISPEAPAIALSTGKRSPAMCRVVEMPFEKCFLTSIDTAYAYFVGPGFSEIHPPAGGRFSKERFFQILSSFLQTPLFLAEARAVHPSRLQVPGTAEEMLQHLSTLDGYL